MQTLIRYKANKRCKTEETVAAIVDLLLGYVVTKTLSIHFQIYDNNHNSQAMGFLMEVQTKP